MKQDKIEALLPLLNSKATGYRAGWVLGRCVFGPWRHASGVDAHPSFGIKSHESKKSICKCLSCGYGGDLQDLLLDLTRHLRKAPASGYNLKEAAQLIAHEMDVLEIDGHSIPEYGEAEKETHEKVFPEYWLGSFKEVWHFPEPMTYLQGRGLSMQMVRAMDVRFDPVQRRVCFPFRNAKAELMGVQGRALDKDNPLRYFQYRYKNHMNSHAWMGEDLLDMDKPVVLVEGPFDLTSVFRVYQNVAASFTSGLSKLKVRRMADAAEVITFYDHGKGGDAARQRIAEVLAGHPLTHLIPTEQQDDAGNMSVEEVAGYLHDHVKLRPFG